MSDCRFGVSPVNYPDPDPGNIFKWNSPQLRVLKVCQLISNRIIAVIMMSTSQSIKATPVKTSNGASLR